MSKDTNIAEEMRGKSRKRRAVGLCLLFATLCAAFRTSKVVSQQPPIPVPEQVAPITVKWREATEFDIEGKGWTATETLFERFPAKAHGVVSEKLWRLSQDSAGVCLRFQTNANQLYVQWSLLSPEIQLPILSSAGASGVDLYQRLPNGAWRHASVGVPRQRLNNIAALPTGNGSEQLREYLLYLPLYNGVGDLKLAVADNYRLLNVVERPESNRRPIAYYGTSIVQGAAASRPGMAFVSIIGRALDRPIINLGFSGSAYLEPEIAQLLAELDPIVFVVDTLKNSHNLPDAILAARIEAMARTLHLTHPKTPILFVGESSVNPDQLPRPASVIQEGVIRKLQQEGIAQLYLLDGGRLYVKDGEGSVDGVHPNDYGMAAHARALIPALQRLIALNK